ncbi:hypothetical protein [Niabella aurantiaca]|uniref:hypothetical protein n=1 Tax=Niabella aurantiaca TaxID=379900 RepID=UPI00037592E7|nr:hypothetical protein [Niabella aurantiaca]
MKLFILTAALSLSLNAMTAVASNPVNEKVMKTFNQVFTDARDVQWNTAAGYSEASFHSGTISVRAMIGNNGNLIRTIRYYKETGLPPNVHYKIRKKYEGKAIFGVTEVTDAAGIRYHVIIHDNRNMYQVIVNNNGNVIEATKYRRGDI